MSSDLVCPECGNESFTATLTTRTEYTYQCSESAGLIEVAESVVDGGDLGDVDEFVCTDCGEGYDAPESQLVTSEAYDEREAALAADEFHGDPAVEAAEVLKSHALLDAAREGQRLGCCDED